MEKLFKDFKLEDMGKMMEMMPKMMESCFPKMENSQREEMWSKCCEMFEQMQKESSK